MFKNKKKIKLIIIYIGLIFIATWTIIDYFNRKNPIDLFKFAIILMVIITQTIYYKKDMV
jgi:hypothetical protein